MKPKIPHLDYKKKANTYRKLLITFLALFQLEGLVSLSVGIWLTVKIRLRECDFLSAFYSSPSLLLASGGIMVIICTIGLVSTYKAQNNRNLRPFVIFIMICLALELAAPINATVDFNYLSDLDLYNSMSSSFEKALLGQSQEMKCWKVMQEKYQCCGLQSFKNWSSDWMTNKTIPEYISKLGLESCQCGKRKRRCISYNVSGVTSVFGVPCYNSFYEDLDFQSLFLRILCPLLFLTQTMTLAFIMFMIVKLQGVNTISTYMVDYNSSADRSRVTPNFVTTDDPNMNSEVVE